MAVRRGTTAHKHPFSLYNLTANEIYFEDYVVQFESISKQDQTAKTKALLKICSKSLVFVPSEGRTAMIKVLYKNIERFEDANGNELNLADSTIFASPASGRKVDENIFVLHCSSVTLMNSQGRIEPYTTDYNSRRILVEFVYTNFRDCLSVIGQLFRSTKLPYAEEIMMIELIVQGLLQRLKFDVTEWKDIHKSILFTEDAYLIKPLIKSPGRCTLTDRFCYFQSLNNIEEQQMIKYELSSLQKLTKRRYKFHSIGCELEFRPVERKKKQKKVLYLVFNNEKICSDFCDILLSQSSIQLDKTPFEEMTCRWQRGLVSNYDYLLYLNDRADRSFYDCSQYPVFPWVLRNYSSDQLDLNDPQSYRDLSKPIGALNIERLERLKERYQNMSLPSDHQRFLYGSFYSNPGFVIYFLCRSYPELSLCLNGGRFDHPDRLFHSIFDCWRSVLTSDSDVKELLPEFYMSSEFNENKDGDKDDDDYRQDGQFLLNKLNVNFGLRHDGQPIGDVELPAWAKDPKDFIYKMRLALESDHVSRHLHEWIDLIFGYKQRGVEAEKADNLFHYLTYGVPERTISKSNEEFEEQLSLETQILEFGQVPKQLFFEPHPKKFTEKERLAYEESREKEKENEELKIDPAAGPLGFESLLSTEEHDLGDFEFNSICLLHKKKLVKILPHPSSPSTHLLTIGEDGFLRNYCVDQMKIEKFYLISSKPLTCFQSISARSTLDNDELHPLAIIGSFDQRIYIHNLTSGTSIFSEQLHDDSIVGLYVTRRSPNVLLLTASADATVRFWLLDNLLSMQADQYIFNPDASPSSSISIEHEIQFEASCTAMDVQEQHELLAVACQDGSIHLCHFRGETSFKRFQSSKPILSMSLRSDGTSLAYLCSEYLTIIDITTDAETFRANSSGPARSFSSFFYSPKMLLIGLTNGSCDVWNLRIREKVLTLNISGTCAINTITYNDGMFFLGSEDGYLYSYVFASRQSASL